MKHKHNICLTMTEDFHANLREELEKFNLATNLQLDFAKFVRYLIKMGLVEHTKKSSQ